MLSIIIISYNTKKITEKCLKTVIESLSHDPNIKAEIIVLDNNSTDGSVQMLRKAKQQMTSNGPKITLRLIESSENLGFAKGNNIAVKKAQGKYLLFLNSDIEALDDAIVRLYSFFATEQNLFNFVGGKLFEKDGKTPQASAGLFYSLPVVFAALFLRGDYIGLTRYSPIKIAEVDWVSGACIMCKKTDFIAIGEFDEKIFMYMDEIDLLYRAKKGGMRIGFYPHACFIHLGSASSHSRMHPILQVYKGFMYFYNKHHSKQSIYLLKAILKTKAFISLAIGNLFGNNYLTETYGQALKIIQND